MAIEIKNLSFAFTGSDRLLSDICLRVKDGECAALTGKNGCGKSTLLSLVAGVAPFAEHTLAGEIKLPDGDRPVYMAQSPEAQILSDTVEEETAFFLKYCDRPDLEIFAKAHDALGLAKLKKNRVRELSSGEKQRLVLTCALACADKKTILLDEPFAYLDADGQTALAALLSDLKKRGAAILLAGHGFEKLTGLIDSFHRIENGILSEGTAQEETFTFAPETAPAAKTSFTLKAENLLFQNARGQNILENFSFTAEGGRLYAITGENGTGKSSAGRLLAGHAAPNAGSIKLNGKAAGTTDLLKNVRYLSPNPYAQLIYRTAGENIAKSGRADALSAYEDVLGTRGLHKRSVSSLSFGQAHRVLLACALAANPAMLIADEIFSNLDLEGANAFAGVFGRFMRADRAVIVISHLPRFIPRNAEKIIRMETIHAG